MRTTTDRAAADRTAAGRTTAERAAETRRETSVKLLRYGPPGQEKPGLLDAEGGLRDLSGVIGDIGGEVLLPGSLERLAALDSSDLPTVSGAPRLGPCVTGIGKFPAVGLNYAHHAKETGGHENQSNRSCFDESIG